MAINDFDDLLNILGTGKWNFIYYIAMSIAIFAMPGFVFSSVFMAPATPYSCILPEFINDSSVSFSNNNCSYSYLDEQQNINVTNQCTSWSYDQSESIESLTSEFDLVCDRAYIRPTFQTLHMIGSCVGSLVNGFLADKFGRTRLIVIGTSAVTIFTFVLTFITNLKMILFVRLLIGLTSSGIFQTGYILCMEITNPKLRSTVGVVIALPWAIGMMWWGTLGFLIRDWRWLQRACGAPFLLVFIFLFFMNDSPRWLIINGKHKEALKCLLRASKWNNKSLPDEQEMYKIMERIENSNAIESPTNPQEEKFWLKKIISEVLKIFKYPEVRRRFFLTCVIFVASAFVYVGMALNSVNFDLNPYLYMILGGIMEIPAYTVVVPIIAKFGRIKPSIITFFFCGVVVMALAFIPRDIKWLIITLAMAGKFANAAAFQIVFLLSSEIFPTDVRIQSQGLLGFVATVAVTAPYITDILGAIYPWFPSIIFGTLSFIASIAVAFLPETLNVHLPETVEQLEKDIKEKKKKKTEKLPKQEEMKKLYLS